MIHDIRFRADSRHAGHDARMQPQGLFDAGVEVRQGFDVGVGGHRVLVGDGGGEFGLDTREVGGVREDFEEGGAQGVGWIALLVRFVIRKRRGHGERLPVVPSPARPISWAS